MPELPEVESLRQMLARSLVGRTFHHATVKEARLRRSVTAELASAIAGRTIGRIDRRAKYLLIEVADDQVMLVHLGMSGSLTHRGHGFDPGQFDSRHDHIEFALDDGSMLVYNDPRRFGLIKIVARTDLNNVAELKYLGPEPLGHEFNAHYLWDATRGRTVAIKNLLMDQRIVAGVGNIYASEILFRAGVRPTRRGGKVTRAEVGRIVTATQEVLREAIGSRGTTFRSYRDSRGQPGRFARLLRVYNREGKPCLKCSTPIRAITLGQRSSFYCPRCQK
ncbi:MAG: bifunctional DNA-formamidopyrimidine glycosylase/DNA-(apurinic or apyrimidinic site) lyase [Deltaproteobacteria bacterium]|nr:bifunctional DNA-formamidopyrimidine glycosylase/DNA-(apurinic or apyrimidinic site) lyase [Deltaproteobacteria bacterium]